MWPQFSADHAMQAAPLSAPARTILDALEPPGSRSLTCFCWPLLHCFAPRRPMAWNDWQQRWQTATPRPATAATHCEYMTAMSLKFDDNWPQLLANNEEHLWKTALQAPWVQHLRQAPSWNEWQRLRRFTPRQHPLRCSGGPLTQNCDRDFPVEQHTSQSLSSSSTAKTLLDASRFTP